MDFHNKQNYIGGIPPPEQLPEIPQELIQHIEKESKNKINDMPLELQQHIESQNLNSFTEIPKEIEQLNDIPQELVQHVEPQNSHSLNSFAPPSKEVEQQNEIPEVPQELVQHIEQSNKVPQELIDHIEQSSALQDNNIPQIPQELMQDVEFPKVTPQGLIQQDEQPNGTSQESVEHIKSPFKETVETQHNDLPQIPQKLVKPLNHENLSETIYDDKPTNCSGIEDVKFDYLLTHTGDPDLNNLFADDKVIVEITETPFITPNAYEMDKIKSELDMNYPINEDNLHLVVNASVAINNVISTKEDEINEGNKIINWIRNQYNTQDNVLVKDLKMFIHNGYVHLVRMGLGASSKIPNKFGIMSGRDTITKELVGDLKYFQWQYDIPIDYDALKYVLFHNEFQNELGQDIEQQKEAEKILAQEYLITLQPIPKYVMWCLKRLIDCWYADVTLQNSIRKIKVLINLYRAKGEEEYNKKHGILPIIVVYPKYGSMYARTVIKKLNDYFMFQMPNGWKCASPSYFRKINNILYYTNGAIDLKDYYRNVLNKSNNVNNESFTPKYIFVNKGTRII